MEPSWDFPPLEERGVELERLRGTPPETLDRLPIVDHMREVKALLEGVQKSVEDFSLYVGNRVSSCKDD